MNELAVEQWLKTTILGIVVLGAGGSIAAVLILGTLKNVFLRFLPSRFTQYSEWRKQQLARAGFTHGYVHGVLVTSEDIFGFVSYYFYHGLRFIFFLAFSIACLILFLFGISQPNLTLRLGTFFPIFLLFLSLYAASKEFRPFGLYYKKEISPLVERAKARLKENSEETDTDTDLTEAHSTTE